MANQGGQGGQGEQQQRGQQGQSEQQGQSDKQAGSTLPPGEKVGEWTEEEEEQGKKADPADASSGGMNAPGQPSGGSRPGNK